MRFHLISSDDEIAKCIELKSEVEIYFSGDLMETGAISDFNNGIVKINQSYMFRECCNIVVVNRNFKVLSY